MRAIVALLLLALAATGCTSPTPPTAPPSAEVVDPRSSDSPDSIATDLAPIYINGTLTSAGGCPVEVYDQLPPQVPGDSQAVPSEAWTRNYDRPEMDPVPTALGAICVLWLDADGAVLAATTGIEGGNVPSGAMRVAVRGNLEVEVPYQLTIE